MIFACLLIDILLPVSIPTRAHAERVDTPFSSGAVDDEGRYRYLLFIEIGCFLGIYLMRNERHLSLTMLSDVSNSRDPAVHENHTYSCSKLVKFFCGLHVIML